MCWLSYLVPIIFISGVHKCYTLKYSSVHRWKSNCSLNNWYKAQNGNSEMIFWVILKLDNHLVVFSSHPISVQSTLDYYFTADSKRRLTYLKGHSSHRLVFCLKIINFSQAGRIQSMQLRSHHPPLRAPGSRGRQRRLVQFVNFRPGWWCCCEHWCLLDK